LPSFVLAQLEFKLLLTFGSAFKMPTLNGIVLSTVDRDPAATESATPLFIPAAE